MSSLSVRLLAAPVLALSLPFSALAAPPTISGDFLFTENRNATSVFAGGHSLVIGANSIQPSGVLTSVQAFHVPGSGTGGDYTLNFVPFSVAPNQYAFRTAYTGQTGQWDIVATNADGSTTRRTHNLSDARILPLLSGVSLTGNHLSWDAVSAAMFPSFCSAPGTPAGLSPYGECAVGYDFFNYQVEVRRITNVAGNPTDLLFTSAAMPTTIAGTLDSAPTGFDLPVGLLAEGSDYLVGVRLLHNELEQINGSFEQPPVTFFSPLENRSVTYLEVSMTAPIPEPETYAMLLAGLGLLGFLQHRRRRQGA